MIVYVYPADIEACGYYRLTWAAMYLQTHGHDVRILHPNHPKRVLGEMDDDGRTLKSVNVPNDADVMVFQRVTSRIMLQAVEAWRSRGVAVVMDIDDDVSVIHKKNPVWSTLQFKSSANTNEYSWQNAQAICDAATLVTVSSHALLRKYAHHGRGRILHNVVPQVALDIQPKRGVKPVFGWGGSVRTHPNDPAVMGHTVGRLQRDGYTFRVIGPSRGVRDAFKCTTEPEITGGVPIVNWLHEIAKLDVGVAPLEDTIFNNAKSWLKPLEYMAVGVPWVGSPVAEYRRLHAHGVGLLASDPRQWQRHIRRLLLDEGFRADQAAAGRALVREKFTIEANAWRWWEAWTDALKIQRGGQSSPFRRPLVATTAPDERGPQAS